ncbi:MAG: PRC-barrel domain-containing protein, partial [Sphingomonadales bacterium]
VPQELSLVKSEKTASHRIPDDETSQRRSGDGTTSRYAESHPTSAVGYRTSKIVGATVVNQADETVGTIDDLIVTTTDKVPYAVLSVGGFLGIGTSYVVVPYDDLEVHDDRMLYSGATKESIKDLRKFEYRD